MSTSMLRYLAERAAGMSQNALADIHSLEDWRAVRDERRREFLRNLSLTALPGGADLRRRDYGTQTGRGYSMRRIGFEIMPDCWSSAGIYYPDPMPAKPAPGVLYVCGHAKIGVHHYQYNAQMWARRGYVCLIVDTIEQSDNLGEHHGHTCDRADLWLSRGYTAAGGELLNSMRALDILADDPAVDAGRLAATGISGGGALSFYLAMADERIRAVSTLCGISVPYDAVGRRRMFGHCDCFYPLNYYARDLSDYAALIAPRAALFCFGDNDALFHPRETAGLVERTRRIYEFYGAGDNCRLLTDPCGHENHPVFYAATQEWFDRHVAGDPRPILEKDDAPELTEKSTMAFNGRPPHPDYLELLPQLMCPRGRLALPDTPRDWPAQRAEIAAQLECASATVNESAPVFKPAGRWHSGKKSPTSQHHGQLATLDLWIETVAPSAASRRLLLSVANPDEFGQQVRGWVTGHAFACAASLAALEPRVAAGNLPPRQPLPMPPGSQVSGVRARLMQAMAITGLTPVVMTIRDIGAALDYLLELDQFNQAVTVLHGRGEGAVAALHHAIGDERIAGLVLENLPATHADGAPVAGIMQICDIPELVGLAAPRRVALVNQGHGNWNWPTRLYQRLECPDNLALGLDMAAACPHAFGAD